MARVDDEWDVIEAGGTNNPFVLRRNRPMEEQTAVVAEANAEVVLDRETTLKRQLKRIFAEADRYRRLIVNEANHKGRATMHEASVSINVHARSRDEAKAAVRASHDSAKKAVEDQYKREFKVLEQQRKLKLRELEAIKAPELDKIQDIFNKAAFAVEKVVADAKASIHEGYLLGLEKVRQDVEKEGAPLMAELEAIEKKRAEKANRRTVGVDDKKETVEVSPPTEENTPAEGG